MAAELTITRLEAMQLVTYVLHRGRDPELTIVRDTAGALHVLERGGRLYPLTPEHDHRPTTPEVSDHAPHA